MVERFGRKGIIKRVKEFRLIMKDVEGGRVRPPRSKMTIKRCEILKKGNKLILRRNLRN